MTEQFGMGELVKRTGVPRTTIHFYRNEDLLPEPLRITPNRFSYDRRHVDALRVIRFLREQRDMSLAEIREILPDLLDDGEEQAFGADMWADFLEDRVPPAIEHGPRARILREAAAAFVARGFPHVNLDDVADAAGVAKGSLYRYYESKEALFLAVVDWTVAELGDRFGDAISREKEPMDEAGAAHVLAGTLDSYLPLFADLFARAVREPQPYASQGVAAWLSLSGKVAVQLERHTAVSPARGVHVLVQAFVAALGRVAGQMGVRPFDTSLAAGES